VQACGLQTPHNNTGITNTLAYCRTELIMTTKSFIFQAHGLEFLHTTNTLAYYSTELIMTIKSIIVQGHRLQFLNTTNILAYYSMAKKSFIFPAHGLQFLNTLAYYSTELITTTKSFIVQAFGLPSPHNNWLFLLFLNRRSLAAPLSKIWLSVLPPNFTDQELARVDSKKETKKRI
jgi:hypothetical protein